MSKITLATVKRFVERNRNGLHILTKSSFDGMVDGCRDTGQRAFAPVAKPDNVFSNNMGIRGAWFVFSSRDYFNAYDDGEFTGIEVYNCCGHFTLAVPKQAIAA